MDILNTKISEHIRTSDAAANLLKDASDKDIAALRLELNAASKQYDDEQTKSTEAAAKAKLLQDDAVKKIKELQL